MAWMPMVPFIGETPRWVRSFLESVLIRAEMAAHNMVFVSACLLVKKDLSGVARSHPAAFPRRDMLAAEAHDDVPTAQELLRRMNGLRALLDNLPTYGRRLLRRIMKRRTGDPRGVRRFRSAKLRQIAARHGLRAALSQGEKRIERPPDKDCVSRQVVDLKIFLPIVGREAKVVVGTVC